MIKAKIERKQTEEAIRELRERFSKQIARELVQWENELQKLLSLPIEPSDVPIYLEYLDADRVLFQLPKESSAMPHTEHFDEDPMKIIATTNQA